MLRQLLRLEVKKIIGAFLTHPAAHDPHDAQVPFRGAVAELAHIDPQGAVSVRDDIADLEVAVQAGGRVRHLLQKGQGTLFECLRDEILLLIELGKSRFVRTQARRVGRRRMEFPGQAGECEGNLLQPLRLLGDDAGERALVLDEFVFGAIAFSVGHQPEGLRRGNAQVEHGAGGQEFRPGPVGLETGVVEFGQGFPVLVGIRDGRTPFSAPDIVVQID